MNKNCRIPVNYEEDATSNEERNVEDNVEALHRKYMSARFFTWKYDLFYYIKCHKENSFTNIKWIGL